MRDMVLGAGWLWDPSRRGWDSFGVEGREVLRAEVKVDGWLWEPSFGREAVVILEFMG